MPAQILFVRPVHHIQSHLPGGGFPVVEQFVQDRLPQLALPVEVGVLLSERPEGTVIEDEFRTDIAVPAGAARPRLREALPHRVHPVEVAVAGEPLLDRHPVDPLPDLGGDVVPHPAGRGLESGEVHRAMGTVAAPVRRLPPKPPSLRRGRRASG